MGRSAGRWGFHRLDPNWARTLVADAALPHRATVLDVGAGTGVLTDALVEAGARVIAIEAHPERIALLRRRFDGVAVVVGADAADLRLPRRPFHVVANPPFAITTPLLRRLLHPASRLESAHVVLQEQAARRWVVEGGRNVRFELSLGRTVPRQAFQPPPRVPTRVLVVRRR